MIIYSHKMQQIASKMGFTNLLHFAAALEHERTKVLMFQRELPLCLELVTHAIDCCRNQLSDTTTENRQSECSEQTSTEMGPVLEEFIPINPNGGSDFELQQSREVQTEKIHDSERGNLNLAPSDWLRSAQLWNQTSDPPPPPPLNLDSPEKTAVVQKNGGAFRPFQKEKTGGEGGGTSSSSAPASTAATSSTAETGSGGNNRREVKEAQNERKQRRCWSPELHRRFLHALQQLGGAHVATPKQIRELMKVDSLTNDEVKSHLQKYRLHTRRPSSRMESNNNERGRGGAPQFLVVGGIWVPTAEYATTACSGEAVNVSATTNGGGGIYAPVVAAAPPQPLPATTVLVQKPKPNPKPKPKHASAPVESSSPTASSSSTHTSSISPTL